MKFSIISVLSLALAATAAPSKADYSLAGFAKDNSIGPTTGGAGKNSQTVTVTSVDALVSAVAGTEPKIIYAKGNFNLTKRLRPGSNKSIIGVGKGAEITSFGISIVNATNVILRNFAIRKIVDNDGITIQNSTRIWIDHNGKIPNSSNKTLSSRLLQNSAPSSPPPLAQTTTTANATSSAPQTGSQYRGTTSTTTGRAL